MDDVENPDFLRSQNNPNAQILMRGLLQGRPSVIELTNRLMQEERLENQREQARTNDPSPAYVDPLQPQNQTNILSYLVKIPQMVIAVVPVLELHYPQTFQKPRQSFQPGLPCRQMQICSPSRRF